MEIYDYKDKLLHCGYLHKSGLMLVLLFHYSSHKYNFTSYFIHKFLYA